MYVLSLKKFPTVRKCYADGTFLIPYFVNMLICECLVEFLEMVAKFLPLNFIAIKKLRLSEVRDPS